jgi:signal transduction histidine kinase
VSDHVDNQELRRLKRLAIAGPLLFLASLEVVRRVIVPGLFETWWGYLLLGVAVILAILLFAQAIFRVIGQTQARLAHQNRELLALHEAGLEIVGQLDLDVVLQTVVDEARLLVGAKYGALLVLDAEGGVGSFFVSGISPEVCARMGPIPVEHGLVGVALKERRALRVPDLTLDPRAMGMPEGHTPMRSLLAVPIGSPNVVLGNLFLTEKEAVAPFSEADEATLSRFSTQAALAIENARLHQQLRALATTEERERIAREMHDSLAQVLGYVNTKAQGIQALLDRGETERASEQLGQLAEAARSAYADVREGILGLRTSTASDQPFADLLGEYVQRWQDQSGILVKLIIEEEMLDLEPLAEVQLLRIVQEALTNVRKHAGATEVTVRLGRRDGWLEVEITDNGRGFEPPLPRTGGVPRFGLSTMRERAEAIGSRFILDAEPGKGTRVVVQVPVRERLGSGR